MMALEKELPSALVALGASTGGPGALLKLLAHLRDGIDTPIVIVQHIEEGFLEGFVTWLKTELRRPVVIATEGQVPASRGIYVAAGHGNLEMTSALTFHYSPLVQKQLYSPNINAFFTNISGLSLIGCAALLTGMGEDGAIGLKDLANSGWSTFVQTPATCVVSGMPESALRLSPRHQAANVEQIAQYIQTFDLALKRRSYAENIS